MAKSKKKKAPAKKKAAKPKKAAKKAPKKVIKKKATKRPAKKVVKKATKKVAKKAAKKTAKKAAKKVAKKNVVKKAAKKVVKKAAKKTVKKKAAVKIKPLQKAISKTQPQSKAKLKPVTATAHRRGRHHSGDELCGGPSTVTITSMSNITIYSTGSSLKLKINGTDCVSVDQNRDEAIYLYVVANDSGNYTVTYDKSLTAPPSSDSSYVRFVAKTSNGKGGYNELSINGGLQGETLIVKATNDWQYNGMEKFNVTTNTYCVYIWYATETYNSATRDAAKFKITTPATPTAESNCDNLPNQSFCYCTNC